jgi:hypothetical protein
MSLDRVAAPFASLSLLAVLTLTGCASNDQPPAPTSTPREGQVEVIGTLDSLKDDRPVDGGVDLFLQTSRGVRERVRVPSSFIAGPRDSIMAMHAVVDAAKVGDRIRARGTRDEEGALRPETLELLR